MRMNAFTLLQRAADCTFDYVFIAPPQYKETWKRAIESLDNHVDWLEEGAWIIIQIHPVEYEAIEMTNLFEFDQRKYGSVLFAFYEFSKQHP